METYQPKKNLDIFFEMGRDEKWLYQWEPIELISIREVQLLMSSYFGAEKVSENQIRQQQIEEFVLQKPDVQYECSYTFADSMNMEEWMSKEEKELVKEMEDIHHEFIKNIVSKKNRNWEKSLQDEEQRYYIDKHGLLHFYKDSNGIFVDLQIFGFVPKIVKFSLYHLLGKAPRSNETYSEWAMYLQFLIDIGYIKDESLFRENLFE